MSSWACMKGCGACCYLEPSERPELEDYLSSEEWKQYHNLVGEDGWCIHYQKDTQACGIYDHRPSFCRVSAENFKQRFGVEEEDFDDFAIDCCCEHIASIYGEESEEMTRYLESVEE